MKKRGLCWLLVVVMLTGMFTSMPIIAGAASGSFGSGIKWEITEDGMLAIGGSGEIPDCSSEGSAPWSSYATDITSVYIKSGITKIGDYALSGLYGITTIALPDTITDIGNYAFMNCSGLADICLSKTLSTLGKGAFLGCNMLTSVSINEENEYFSVSDGCLFDKTKTVLILSLPGTGKTAFTVPDGIITLDDYAFRGNAQLDSVKIPASVKVIGDDVFTDCLALSTIYYKGSTEEWSGLTIGTNNEILDRIAIQYDYVNATSISLDYSEISLNVGSSKALTAQILPENASDKTVVWTSSDEDIATVKDGIVTAVDEGTAVITATNEIEGLSASCTVTTVYVPLNVMEFEKTELNLIIYESEKLNIIFTPADASDKKITWESSNPQVAWVDENGTVTATNGGSTVITATSSSGYTATCVVNVTLAGDFGDGLHWEITTDEDSSTAATGGGCLTISGSGDIPDYVFSHSSDETAGDGTVTGSGAPWADFPWNINEIVIEEGITGIGDFAFSDCKYAHSVTIADSVTSIGKGAFAAISNLSEFNVSDSNTAFSVVDNNLFNKDKTVLIARAANGGDIYYVPESVTEIAPYAFYSNYRLLYVIIDKNVKTIGEYAFDCCPANIKFYYKGSEDDWNDVIVDEGNNYLSNITYNMTNATGIKLNKTKLELMSNTSEQLAVTFTPANTSLADVIWSISDSNIASISDDGTVYAYNAGIATIKATSIDGGFTAECTVEVTGNGSCGANANWTLSPDHTTLTLSGWGATYNYSWNGNQPWNMYNSKITRVIVENGVSTLGSYLFAYMANCRSVSLPVGLSTIKYSVFNNCTSLKSITIPDSVTTIEDDAFSNCTSLENVKLSNNLYSINQNTFSNCAKLSSLVIPDSVEKIGFGVFQNCSALKTLVVGTKLSYVDKYVFPNQSPLTIYYKGTESDWGKISIGNNNNPFVYSTRIYGYTPATKITLDSSSLELWVGDSGQLAATVTPDDAIDVVLWSSSDESVATVNADGKVIAHSQGTATITATSVGGECSASCTVTTKNIPVSGMYIEESSVDMIRDKEYGLKIVFTPENATNKKLKWTTSDENVVKISNNNGVLLATGAGTATVTAVTEDGEFTDSCQVNVVETIASGALENGITWILDFSGTLTIEGNGALPDFELPIYNQDREDGSTAARNSGVTGGGGVAGGSGSSSNGGKVDIENADKIAPWYNYRGDIRYVNIQKGITSVGDYAFQQCYSLNSAYLANTVTSIGEHAFEHSQSLNWISLPESLVSIENYAFYGTNIQGFHIPKNVSSIGEYVFANIYNLSSITVDDKNKSFIMDNNSLLDINRTRLIKHLNISGETYYQVPQTVTTIDPYAFHNNSYLQQVVMYDGLKTIGDSAFANCYQINSVNLPSTLTTLGKEAFSNCGQLAYIHIPEGVTEIPEAAFRSCSNLQNIYLNNNVTKIGNYAFAYCYFLNSISLPEGLTEIGESAFSSCSMLSNIILPESLVEIGSRAFSDCSQLYNVILPDGLEKIGDNAFWYCPITHIEIPASVKEIGVKAFTSENTYNIIVSADNTAYADINGVLFNKDKTDIIYYPGGRQEVSYMIPDGTVTIKEGAFSRAKVSEVIIPSSVTTIETSAFQEAYGLTTVSIPDSVTSIGDYAFAHSNITRIALPSSITEIPQGMMNYCYNLNTVTLGKNVTSIAPHAFTGCNNLNTIKISSALTSIGMYAFDNCSSLTNVLYSSDAEAWDAITINEGNASLINAAVTTNSKFVTGISLDKTNLTLAIGDEVQLSATVSPDDAANNDIEWFSSLPHVAAISPDGLVTAASGGKTIITAKSMDGGYVAYCTVCVATSGTCGENLTWEFSGDGTLTISGEGAMTDFISNADDTAGTTTVISAPWSMYSPQITKIVVEDGVTTIGARAFANAHNAETVILPDSIISIGEYAFEFCESLTEINIPKNTESIENGAFSACVELRRINVSEDNTSFESVDGVLFNEDKTVLICYPAGKTDKEYQIPASVTEVAPYAFKESHYLETIIMNKGLLTISDYAFAECFKLRNLVIPSSVTTLGENPFRGIALTSAIYEGNKDSFEALLSTDPTGMTVATLGAINVTYNSTMPINAKIQDLFCDGTWLSVTVELGSIIKPATAIFALYDRSGALVKTLNKPVSAENGSATAVNHLPFDMRVNSDCPGYTVKVFFWDMTSMKPLGYAISETIPTTVEWETMYESEHPYKNNTVEELQGFTYDKDCVSIDVTFSANTETEKGQDFIYIYGENNTLFKKYSGNELAGKTITIPGNTFMIKLESDDMLTGYGYRTEKIVINKI